MVKVTAKDLQRAFYNREGYRYELVAPNVYLDSYSGEMDILCIRKSGFIDEIEIKISVSDFKADFKKTLKILTGGVDDWGYPEREKILKHESLPLGYNPCNRFYFLLPEDIYGKVCIPEYSGLYIYKKSGVIYREKEAPLLHRRKITLGEKYSIGRKMCYRYWDQLKIKDEG